MISIFVASEPSMEAIHWTRRHSSTDGAAMNILEIHSSARRDASQSTRRATRIAERLRDAAPGSTVTVRDLGHAPHPALDEAALTALFTPAADRDAEQAARV